MSHRNHTPSSWANEIDQASRDGVGYRGDPCRWKILSGPSPVRPDFPPDSQGSGGLPGCTGLGRRWWVASTFRPVIMLPTFPRLDQTRSLLFPGPILCEPNGTREKPGRSTGVLPARTSCPVECTKRTWFGLYSRGLSRGNRRSPSKGLRRRGVPFRGPVA